QKPTGVELGSLQLYKNQQVADISGCLPDGMVSAITKPNSLEMDASDGQTPPVPAQASDLDSAGKAGGDRVAARDVLPPSAGSAFARRSVSVRRFNCDQQGVLMIDASLVEVSRLQFALTALFHFLFVPLALGLSFLLAIMESAYVLTQKTIYRDMTKFWGKLFGINFALGVTTGITLEFQFGTNWAYYSHYVGDIFGVPLAIEGLMAFFLESTFIGLFFFGWDRLSRQQHLLVTILMAVGTKLSALWILIANGWMQNPVGSEFSYETMRMELTDFWAVVFNPVAQVKFVHTVSAGYVTGAIFVLAISSYYLLKGRDVEFAKRSFRVAAAFGLASVLSVIVLGDESGYTVGEAQQTKMAALEAMWETEPAPAGLKLVAGINE